MTYHYMAIADNLYYKIKPEENTFFKDVIEKIIDDITSN